MSEYICMRLCPGPNEDFSCTYFKRASQQELGVELAKAASELNDRTSDEWEPTVMDCTGAAQFWQSHTSLG